MGRTKKAGIMINSNLRWNLEDESKIFGEADPKLVARFKDFHEKNGSVYFKFFDYANRALCRGFKKYSAVTIIHTIRWEEDLKSDSGEVFKINNDYIALYARLLIWHHPIFKDFFELREMKSDRRQISDLQRERELEKASGF